MDVSLQPQRARPTVAVFGAGLVGHELAALPAGAHVLVMTHDHMTHDHAEDLVLCDAALRRNDLGTVGLIGSCTKWARFRARLREEGHAQEAVERITCPIGLAGVPGKAPAAIAVSVAADPLRALAAPERRNS